MIKQEKSSDLKVTIRECRIEDCAAFADIYNVYVRQGTSTMDAEEKDAAYYEHVITGFNDRETILTLEEGGEVVGWGIIKRYSDRLGYRVACETSVYLDPNHLRKGYGSLMKKALIVRCKEYGYRHLVAKIFAENEGSIAYNERLGYEVVGRQREIGFRNGRWMDVVIMQLILEDVPAYRPELG